MFHLYPPKQEIESVFRKNCRLGLGNIKVFLRVFGSKHSLKSGTFTGDSNRSLMEMNMELSETYYQQYKTNDQRNNLPISPQDNKN